MSPSAPNKRFRVALSFPGEKRGYVEKVAAGLALRFGEEAVLYDRFHTAEFADADLTFLLPDLYRKESDLIVAVLCADYEKKPWCGLEWRAIYSHIKNGNSKQVMLFRGDSAEIRGLHELEGFVPVDAFRPDEAVKLILQRLARNEGKPRDSYLGDRTASVGAGALCPHNLPFASIHGLLKGREGEMGRLVAGDGAMAITQAIQGLGGVGKTRLAVELGWKAVREGTHRVVGFVGADSLESLRANLAGLVGEAMLNLPEREAREQSVQTEAALRWFAGHDRWLLIFDNVDTRDAMTAVRALLPRLSRGRVVVTSRLRGWGAGVEPVELTTLGEDDAVRFLLERATGRARPEGEDGAARDEADARTLARHLDGLPLALEQAAAFLDAGGGSFAEYLRDWDRDRARVLSWCDKASGVPVAVAMTWQRTWDVLSPGARALLRMASFLAPEPIPVGLVTEEACEKWIGEACRLLEGDGKHGMGEGILKKVLRVLHPKEMAATGKAERESDRPGDSLGELVRYSMVNREAETFSVHRIVQEVIRSRIPEDQRKEWVELALNWVDDFFPGDPPSHDVRSWGRWVPMQPHVVAVVQEADRRGIPDPMARLMNELGLFLFVRAEYGEAEPLMRRALGIDEASFGPDHPSVARDLSALAVLFQATNRLSEAEPLMRRALGIFEKAYGENHPNVATALNNLASLLQATNRLSEAEPLMRRALGNDEVTFGPDHPSVAIRLNNLGTLLQATNRLSEAEPLIRRALGIDEESFGPDHPSVARDLNNLASVLEDTNRLSEAEPLMRRALAIDEGSYGPNHPKVAIRLNNLGQLLQATNRLSEAEPLMLRALAIDEASFGSDHPDVARDLNNLARLLQATNRLSEAEPLMRRARGIDEASFGPDHPNVAIDLGNLGMIEFEKGNAAEAERLLERALGIFRASFRDGNHSYVVKTLQRLEVVRKGKEEKDEV